MCNPFCVAFELDRIVFFSSPLSHTFMPFSFFSACTSYMLRPIISFHFSMRKAFIEDGKPRTLLQTHTSRSSSRCSVCVIDVSELHDSHTFCCSFRLLLVRGREWSQARPMSYSMTLRSNIVALSLPRVEVTSAPFAIKHLTPFRRLHPRQAGHSYPSA